MIRVTPAPEPADFEDRVRGPGRRTLLELIGDPSAPVRRGPKRKPVAEWIEDIPAKYLEEADFWTRAIPALMILYRGICAYLGMRIHEATGAATVDHFVPKSKAPSRAYDWSNFRLVCAQINSNKGDHEDVLDPFLVEDTWFVMDIGSFALRPADGLSPETRARVEATLARLDLNGPTFCEARARYHDRYHGLKTDPDDPDEPWPLSWLARECPLVERQLRQAKSPAPRGSSPEGARMIPFYEHSSQQIREASRDESTILRHNHEATRGCRVMSERLRYARGEA